MALGSSVCAPSIPNSTGEAPGLQATGTTSVSENDLTLWASDLHPDTFGLALVSATPGNTPAVGGGVGTLCLGGAIGRFNAPGQVRSAGPLGRFSLRVDTSAIPQNVGTQAIQPGETWIFQLWYRDEFQGQGTSNLTSARSITFQ